jgi:hypothetical protein
MDAPKGAGGIVGSALLLPLRLQQRPGQTAFPKVGFPALEKTPAKIMQSKQAFGGLPTNVCVALGSKRMIAGGGCKRLEKTQHPQRLIRAPG